MKALQNLIGAAMAGVLRLTPDASWPLHTERAHYQYQRYPALALDLFTQHDISSVFRNTRVILANTAFDHATLIALGVIFGKIQFAECHEVYNSPLRMEKLLTSLRTEMTINISPAISNNQCISAKN